MILPFDGAGALRAHEVSCVLLVAGPRLWLGQDIGRVGCARQVLELDFLGFDLFDEETQAGHEVTNLAVITCERLAKSNGTLVVDV